MANININSLPIHLQEVWSEMLMSVDTNIKLDDVILSDENKEKIKSFIKEVKYRDILNEYGLQMMNRLLFYGASGTGKTFLAKALSNHLGFTMLYVDISKALTEGNVSQNIANIFELANYIGNCIIMLDECDSIAWNRDTGTAESGIIRRATNSIFQYMDQMNNDVIVIAATNMLHRLDAAFERRFNLKLMFTRPTLDMDEIINQFMLPKFELIDDVNNDVRDIVKKRAKQNVKLSYYEIQTVVERAMKNAILNDTIEVKSSDIYKMLADNMNFKVRFGTNLDSKEMFSNTYTYDPEIKKG